MPRILVGQRWYEAIASTDFFEVHYETLVIQHAGELYPEYFAVPFKTPVSSQYGTRKADLALIDRRYRTWWVVEVELAHHPLYQHVVPQIQVLATASYGVSEAEYLARQDVSLELDQIIEMMRGAPPRVLVLVNEPVPEWTTPLAMWGVAVGVVEVFRSDLNEVILRVNGEQPSGLGALVSACRCDPSIPSLVLVDSPASLGEGNEGRFVIEFEGAVSEWKRVNAGESVWLAPRGRNPLPASAEIELLHMESGRLVFRVKGEG